MSSANISDREHFDTTLLSRRLIARLAALHGPRVLFSIQNGNRTYSEVANIIRNRSRQMLDVGVSGKVIVSLPSSVEFIYTFFALFEAGAVPVLSNPALTSRESESIREDCGAQWVVQSSGSGTLLCELDSSGKSARERVLVTDPEQCAPTELVEAPEQEDTDAYMLYTSGSTGRIKGVVHTLGSFIRSCSQVATTVETGPGDRYLIAVPFFHAFGFQFGIMTALLNGATIVSPENVGALGLLEQVEGQSITVVVCGAGLLRQLVTLAESKHLDLSCLRFMVVAGAAVSPNVMTSALTALCPRILNFYGTSEAGGISVTLPNDPLTQRVATVGRPVPGIEMRIVDDDHNPVSVATLGEVACRTPGCFREYLNMPDATLRAKDRSGWYYTGDLGYLDEAGYLTLAGRKDDVINKSGFKVYPEEINRVLSCHPEVTDCIVVGIADELCGTRIRAVVCTARGSGSSARELKLFCAERLVYYKVPDEIILVDALPRGPTGKVDKELLRSSQRSPTSAL
jgi:acyl-CoA synthetase (AMP-forming)/AMP-acid ligase II